MIRALIIDLCRFCEFYDLILALTLVAANSSPQVSNNSIAIMIEAGAAFKLATTWLSTLLAFVICAAPVLVRVGILFPSKKSNLVLSSRNDLAGCLVVKKERYRNDLRISPFVFVSWNTFSLEIYWA